MNALLPVALFVCGLLVGNELCVGAFVHPALRRLPDGTHAAAAQALARVFGAVMPFWYAAALLLTSLLAWTLRGTGAPFLLAAASAALWLFAIVYTLLGPVRINNEVARWNLDALPADWKTKRARWDFLHAVRVGMLLFAFVLLLLAAR